MRYFNRIILTVIHIVNSVHPFTKEIMYHCIFVSIAVLVPFRFVIFAKTKVCSELITLYTHTIKENNVYYLYTKIMVLKHGGRKNKIIERGCYGTSQSNLSCAQSEAPEESTVHCCIGSQFFCQVTPKNFSNLFTPPGSSGRMSRVML